jgi:hypothetical protein
MAPDDWKNLYSEVKNRKMQALGKQEIVKAVEKHGKILAIKGKYEKPEKCIGNCYASVKEIIRPEDVPKQTLSLYDVVLVGCPGSEIPKSGLSMFRDYVYEEGGWLLTTDWCLRTIVENAFPGYMHWGGEKTDDVVVQCEMVDAHHPFLDGIFSEITQGKYAEKGPKAYGKNTQPTFSWWLEDKSFPITIDRPDIVHVLIRSEEIGRKWGKDPVLCYFDGRVIHMISHTHLQKGGEKGHFVSAMILTNILDEKVGIKHGIKKGGGTPQYVDYASSPSSQQSSIEWSGQAPVNYETYSGGADSSAGMPEMPSGQSNETSPELTGTTQIIEITDKSKIGLNQKCCFGDGGFDDYQGHIFQCGCGTLYHEECLNVQLREGICKICEKIFLY